MSMLDFLFEGKPPTSVTTYGTTTSDMPRWLSDYTQGLISRANSVAAEPYQAYNGPRLAEMSPDQLRAFDVTRSTIGGHQGSLNSAMGTVNSVASGPLGMAAAQPYMNAASRTFPQAAQEYMNPYTENVINRASTLTNRALNEQLLPSLARVFGSSGQDARSSSYRRAADRGVRDLAEGLQGQSLAALSDAYTNAGTMFNQDASRMGTLAGVAGNLAGSDATTRLNAAQQQGTLAQLGKSLDLTDASALETIGRTQQNDQQRSLDLAYQDFTDQRDYPRSTIDWMSSVIRGLPAPSRTTTTETAPGDAQVSPLMQLGSLATGIGGVMSALNKARGGRIRRVPPRSYGTLRRY